MRYISYAVTDIGGKQINQDSYIIKEAMTESGPVLFAAVCDGMGGLEDGHMASGMLIEELDKWFNETLPDIIEGTDSTPDRFKIYESLEKATMTADEKIRTFAAKKNEKCGSTVTGILFMNGRFYCINVGDSRIYVIRRHRIHRLTKDQTVAQQEADKGVIKQSEVDAHPKAHMLIQCIGAGAVLHRPVFSEKSVKDGDLFIICSDGLRHKVTDEEFSVIIEPDDLNTEKDLADMARYLVSINKVRGEKDNITCILIKAEK